MFFSNFSINVNNIFFMCLTPSDLILLLSSIWEFSTMSLKTETKTMKTRTMWKKACIISLFLTFSPVYLVFHLFTCLERSCKEKSPQLLGAQAVEKLSTVFYFGSFFIECCFLYINGPLLSATGACFPLHPAGVKHLSLQSTPCYLY